MDLVPLLFLARTQLGHFSVTTWLHAGGRGGGGVWVTVLNSLDELGLNETGRGGICLQLEVLL